MDTREEVNGYTLQPEIYQYENRYVKIYSPIVVLGTKMAFWVYCMDDGDIIVVDSNKLRLANNRVQVLFGGRSSGK